LDVVRIACFEGKNGWTEYFFKSTCLMIALRALLWREGVPLTIYFYSRVQVIFVVPHNHARIALCAALSALAPKPNQRKYFPRDSSHESSTFHRFKFTDLPLSYLCFASWNSGGGWRR